MQLACPLYHRKQTPARAIRIAIRRPISRLRATLRFVSQYLCRPRHEGDKHGRKADRCRQSPSNAGISRKTRGRHATYFNPSSGAVSARCSLANFRKAQIKATKLDRDHRHACDLCATTDFDYNAPADLFPARGKKGNRPFGYRRFETAAEAIRYAIEVMPLDFLAGAVLEVDKKRVDGPRIRELYDSETYPLARKR